MQKSLPFIQELHRLLLPAIATQQRSNCSQSRSIGARARRLDDTFEVENARSASRRLKLLSFFGITSFVDSHRSQPRVESPSSPPFPSFGDLGAIKDNSSLGRKEPSVLSLTSTNCEARRISLGFFAISSFHHNYSHLSGLFSGLVSHLWTPRRMSATPTQRCHRS